MNRLKHLLIGKPLKTSALKQEKYGVFWGLPILASDALSSVAYASEEILLVLLPVVGLSAYYQVPLISLAILGLLIILVLSYRQTIESYPSGGGAYTVAKDNLGIVWGITAGSALSVGYVLTVAVSISSATAAIVAIFPALYEFKVLISILLIVILTIGNLRGIRESAKIFSIPTYTFILGIIIMIIYGIAKVKILGYTPPQPSLEEIKTHLGITGLESLSLIIILKAFSSGMAALTGIEAVSNAVPNFKEPTVKNAKITMALLGLLVTICFGGTSLLVSIYPAVPVPYKTVLSQVANQIFGNSFMYYYIQINTMIILALAANTAYTGFPSLISVMAKEGYAPRQLALRGDRLSFSNGILLLSILVGLLILIFESDTHLLIPLYAVGVFMSFTLSQTGMFVRWLRKKKEEVKGKAVKALINGIGAFLTGAATIIIGITKFTDGAWIVIVIIPLLIYISWAIKKHYTAVAYQLRVTDEELSNLDITASKYRNHVIVPIQSLNKASIRALRYARTISDNVVAFHVAITEEDAEKLRKRWNLLKTDIRLVIKYSPYRKIIEPLLRFVESEEHEYKPGDMLTVILPQFSVSAWWHIFLHNQTRLFIANKLLKHKHIVVATMPLQLKTDDVAIKKYLKKKVHQN